MQYVITFNNDPNTSFVARAKTEYGAKKEATKWLHHLQYCIPDSVSVTESSANGYGSVWKRTLSTGWKKMS